MYDVRRLILLRDLSERATLTAVSHIHGITTSAVSQQLRLLEDEVGAVLTRREGRVLRLTYTGRVLVEHTARVLAALEEAESAVAATAESVTGVLTLATFGTAQTGFALPAVTRLMSEYPGLRVRIVNLMPVESVPAVRAQEVDLAITYAYSFATTDLPLGLNSDFLYEDPLVLLAPAGLREQAREYGLAAVRDCDWITDRDGAPSVASVLFACRDAGFAPHIQHRCGTFAAMAEMVAHGLGVALVPELSVSGERRALVACSVPGATRRIAVTYRQASADRPAVAAAVRALRAVAQPHRVAS